MSAYSDAKGFNTIALHHGHKRTSLPLASTCLAASAERTLPCTVFCAPLLDDNGFAHSML